MISARPIYYGGPFMTP